MIDRDESELIARERRNQRFERETTVPENQWRRSKAANDAAEPAAFRTLVPNRANRYLTDRN